MTTVAASVAVLVFTAAALTAGCDGVPFVDGSECPGQEATSRGDVDVEDYSQANRAVLRQLPHHRGASEERVSDHPYYRCPGSGIGDTVGVTTIGHYNLDVGVEKCDAALEFERGLEEAGWIVTPEETELDDGWARGTSAWKDSAEVNLRIDTGSSQYAVSVDHDVPKELWGGRPESSSTVSCRDHEVGLNSVETMLSEALASFGVEAQPGDHAVMPGTASLYAELSAGSFLYVSAYPREYGDFRRLDSRTIAGIRVDRVEYSPGDRRDRFNCDGLFIEPHGDVPPTFEDFDDFLEAFINRLGCGDA